MVDTAVSRRGRCRRGRCRRGRCRRGRCRRPGVVTRGRHREGHRADGPAVPEVQVEVVAAGTGHRGVEDHLGPRGGAAVTGGTVGVDVEVGQVTGSERDEVTVGTQVGLEVGDGPPVARHGQRQGRLPARRQVTGQAHRVAADLGRARLPGGGPGAVAAGDREVGAERERVGSAGLEVREQSPLARGEVERGGPGAVVGQGGVDVLEAGEVAAYGDQVEQLLVLHVVRRDGAAARPGDREPHRHRSPGLDLGLRQVEGVAALRDRQPPGCAGIRRRVRPGPLTLGGVRVVSARHRVAERTDGVPHPQGRGERGHEPGEERDDARGRAHASW